MWMNKLMWMNKFENQITNAYLEGCQRSIMGDFNIDLLLNNTSSKSWLHLNEDFQLHQLINEPTRVTLNSATLVDHVDDVERQSKSS
jgi:exonuclease III